MKKINKILIIGFISAVLVLIIIFLSTKNKDQNLEQISSFKYYYGSSSYGTEFIGKIDGDLINIEFKEINGQNKNIFNYTISFDEFKKILNKTNIESCERHTYDYQCGNMEGCSYYKFSVNYLSNLNDDICYKVNSKVSNFFDNLIDSHRNTSN